MLKLIEAKPLANYRLQLQFSDGRSGLADLTELVDAPAFAELREPAAFAQCRIEHGALNWTSALDLAPEYLYFLAFRSDASLTSQFKFWGYL